MGPDPNPEVFQCRQEQTADGDQGGCHATGKMSAAAIVLKAVILAKGGVVGVGGTGQAILIVPAAGVFVGNDDTDGGAGGSAVKDAAEDLETVGLLPRRIQRGGGTAPGELPGNGLLADGDAGGKTIDDGTYRRTVAFAEQGDGDALTKGIFHGVTPTNQGSPPGKAPGV